MLTGAILILDNEQKTRASAKALAVPFNAVAGVKLFNDPSCLAGLSANEGERLVILGHTDGNKYGGYKAKAFAEKLASRAQKDKKNKLNIKDLYLIGCEVGLLRPDRSSIAQNIANELHKLGFKNVRVHAVATPANRLGDAMYVEVKHDERLKSIYGYLDAYLMLAADAKALDKAADGSKDHIYKTPNRRFLGAANPAVVLNEEVNVFLPNETLAQRNSRIGSKVSQSPVSNNDQEPSRKDNLNNTFYIAQDVRIDQRIKQLEDEIKAINPPCFFPFFANFEINTKQQKIAALNKIKNAATPVAREMALNDALDDSRVMRSAKTSRTRDLLTNLQEKTEDHKAKLKNK